ncbi:MAG: hypothetical protein GY846_18410 [Deltaproteobacteria bacterium]|nr:hypothetical protein [Deltaproteobacteria bacterium]
MNKLIIKGQGKTDYFPELQAEISAQTYCRMAFRVSRKAAFWNFVTSLLRALHSWFGSYQSMASRA